MKTKHMKIIYIMWITSFCKESTPFFYFYVIFL